MHPSQSLSYDPISYFDQAFCCTSFQNQTSKQDQTTRTLLPNSPPPLSFSHYFPSDPFELDNEIFPEQNHDFLFHLADELPVVNINMEVSINKNNNNVHHQIPARSKRSCKRDRHSKISTARGMRDRRMRLSLEVAKRFFGLQDMLGFEKASKTVEWLLNQAKEQIKQLAREKNILHPTRADSSTSECEEGVSSLDEVAIGGGNQEPPPAVVLKKKRRTNKGCCPRKSAFNPLNKESREKARERARERTKEKMRSRTLVLAAANEPKHCKEAIRTTNHNNLTQTQTMNLPFLDVMTEAEEPSSHTKKHLDTHDDSLAIMSKWSPSMILNSLNNSGLFQEHQHAGFQSLGKTWEAYNNHI